MTVTTKLHTLRVEPALKGGVQYCRVAPTRQEGIRADLL